MRTYIAHPYTGMYPMVRTTTHAITRPIGALWHGGRVSWRHVDGSSAGGTPARVGNVDHRSAGGAREGRTAVAAPASVVQLVSPVGGSAGDGSTGRQDHKFRLGPRFRRNLRARHSHRSWKSSACPPQGAAARRRAPQPAAGRRKPAAGRRSPPQGAAASRICD